MSNDATLILRLPGDLKARFAACSPDMSSRLRYLIERDLKERERKRRVTLLTPSNVTDNVTAHGEDRTEGSSEGCVASIQHRCSGTETGRTAQSRCSAS